MTKNRFKNSAPKIDFDDPTALTARPEDFKPEEVIPTDPVEEKPAKEPKKKEVAAPAENPLAGKLPAKKEAGKGYALYLDTDVVEALDKLAKQNKISRSKALNELLRSILLDK